MLIPSPVDKIALFDKLRAKYYEKGDLFSCLACEREKTANMINTGQLDQAIAHVEKTLQSNMFEQVTHEQQVEAKACLLYEKGRAVRKRAKCKRETSAFVDAMKCFDNALELYDSLPNKEMLILEIASVHNAKGNVLFDQKRFNESYVCHGEAAHKVKEYVGNDSHPLLTIFEFNLGTVSAAKGEDENLLYGNHRDKTPSKHFEEALQMFNSCIKRDREIGNDRLPPFAEKLSHRASVLQRLHRYEEAVDDRCNAIELLEVVYPGFHKTKTDAYIKQGNTFLKWRRTYKSGTAEPRAMLNLALQSLEKVEKSASKGAPPSDNLKRQFLIDYKAVAVGGVPRSRQCEILGFCEKYDSGQPLDADTSDSDSTQSESTDEEKRESTTSDCGMDYDQSENTDEHASVSPESDDAARFEALTMQGFSTHLNDEGNQSSKRSISDDDMSD